MCALMSHASLAISIFFLLLASSPASAAFIKFDNCLNPAIVNSNPRQLQWTPLFFDAKFDTASSAHGMNITVYGNVSGQQVQGTLPPPSDPTWQNPNVTFGKINDTGNGNDLATLLAAFKVLTYDAYNAKASDWCGSLINGTCPLGPYFTANASNPYELPAFRISHDFGAPYRFCTLTGTIRIISGDATAPSLACVSASITPDLGPAISGLITWLPAAILILKGLATLSAAIWSPWGSSDIFRWSSNYGRDEDLLRLVTPGFGDCLQYIQFVALTGALTLNYPGFYQPAISRTAWSLLLFNQSYVSHGPGTQALVDGIYANNGTYGMTSMSQLIGMTSVEDIWACMAIWLLIIAGIVVLLCQLGFVGRWIYRTATNTTEEDLRQKNLPFTLGNMIRLLFNYFILPIVALSLFQLVIAAESPTAVVVMAVMLLLGMLAAGGWILRVIFTTKPATYLFDDMPIVLLYGPLYNTYSDSAAPFTLVPVFITFMRGVAIGAVQPSGIAQIIILAICEVIFILTLNGFRPFQNQTSMNAYHTFFAIVRLIAVLLAIAFVPSLGVSESSRGWIGYAILLLHACVLVFGFFLNAAQTLIEVVARSLGVAGDAQHGAIRGSVLSLRMLKRRKDRPRAGDRGSMTSNAAILRDSSGDDRNDYAGGRSRSISASSQQLLNQGGASGASGGTPSMHRISGYDNFSANSQLMSSNPADPDRPQTGYTHLPLGGLAATSGQSPLTMKTDVETYYRPPRPRRPTTDPLTTSTKTRLSDGSVLFPYQDSPSQRPVGHARDSSYGDSPAPAYFRDRAESNENLPRPDYAVREVDQYYRGPALSVMPTRKLKTGPADPEGPAASAKSWFQKMVFGVTGKQKETTKGFEVMRSSRMPREMQDRDAEEALELQTSPRPNQEPYRDSPPPLRNEMHPQAMPGAERSLPTMNRQHATGFGVGGNKAASPLQSRREPDVGFVPNVSSSNDMMHPGMRAEQPSLREKSLDAARSRPSADTEQSNYGRGASYEYQPSSHYPSGHSVAPTLPGIEPVGDIVLPSRFNTQRSKGRDVLDADGGEDWLRAVDKLSWNHGERAAAPATTGRGTATAPGGLARRTSALDPTGQKSEDVFSGFDSAHASLDLPPALHDDEGELDRPASYINVRHHRAADSVSRNSFGATAALHGQSAEVGYGASPAEADSFEPQHGR